MSQDDIHTFLFKESSHPLAAPLARWSAASRRFGAFVTVYRTKLRKKLRAAQDPESVRDLGLELETAYLLLRERSLSLEYEPQAGVKTRAPDFAVGYTSSSVFMVEVTRLRAPAPKTRFEAQERALRAQASPPLLTTSPLDERFAGMVSRKLGQVLPGCSNVLLVGVEPPCPTLPELHDAMLDVQRRAEGSDATLVQRYDFRDCSDFFRHYRRLSAVLVRGTDVFTSNAVLWVNPQAQVPLPNKVRAVLCRSHTLEAGYS